MKENYIYPKNKKHFKKLISFAKRIFMILKKAKISFVIYSSCATFFYTHDKNLEVHDLDVLIKDKDYPKIMNLLKKNKIKFKFLPEWDTLEIKKGQLKIDLDRMGRGGCKDIKEGSLPRKTNKQDFYGMPIKIITLQDLYNTYLRGYNQTLEDKSKLRKKLKYLENFLNNGARKP